MSEEMSFTQALEELNIQDYEDRILNSNSHGELFHTMDYIYIAQHFKDKDSSWFKEWFEAAVRWAEKNWHRPESIFQHIPRMLEDTGGRVLDVSLNLEDE